MCGASFTHLGLHVFRGHGITAATYRLEHGLLRSRGLVSPELREKLAAQAAANEAAQRGLAATRDPARASEIRRALARPTVPAAAAERDQRFTALGRSTRNGRVTTCAECGVQFCALQGSKRRRFCSYSCASKTTRRNTAKPKR